jgi:hypothetical protein
MKCKNVEKNVEKYKSRKAVWWHNERKIKKSAKKHKEEKKGSANNEKRGNAGTDNQGKDQIRNSRD